MNMDWPELLECNWHQRHVIELHKNVNERLRRCYDRMYVWPDNGSLNDCNYYLLRDEYSILNERLLNSAVGLKFGVATQR